MPYHVERGGSVTLKDRYIISLGSTHDKDSFRVGANSVGVPNPCKNGKCGKGCSKPCKAPHLPPDMALGDGILTYYGDDVSSHAICRFACCLRVCGTGIIANERVLAVKQYMIALL